MSGPEPGDLLGELAEAKAALARVEKDRDERVAAAKQQLAEGRTKAKQLFAQRVKTFEKRIAELEDSARARDEENAQLKSMLREADDRANAAERKACDVTDKLAAAETRHTSAANEAVASALKERDEANRKVSALEAELVAEGRRRETAVQDCGEAVRERNEARELLESRETELVRTSSLVEDTRKENEVLAEERKKVQERVLQLEERMRQSVADGVANGDVTGATEEGTESGVLEREVTSDLDEKEVRGVANSASCNGGLSDAKPEEADAEDLKALKMKLKAANERIEDFIVIQGRHEKAMEEQRHDLSKAHSDAARSESALVGAREELDGKLEAAQERISVLETDLESKTEQVRRMDRALTESRQTLESGAVPAENVGKARSDSGTRNVSSSGGLANGEANEADSEVRVLKEELERTKKSVSDAVSALSAAKVSAANDLRKAEEKIAVLAKERDEASDKLKEIETVVPMDSGKSSASGSAESWEEEKKILGAKVSELERLLSSKQAEMVKTREKARTYLKDITAEKRDMENKLREEMAVLVKAVESEKENAVQAGKEMERVTKELDGCLSVIAEKQKSIQSLMMTFNTEREATEAAKCQTAQLQEEFLQYKERARAALAERDEAVESASGNAAGMTAELEQNLRAARAEIQELRLSLKEAEGADSRLTEVIERARKAEAALELLKKDSSSLSSTNVARIDALEEEADVLRKQLSASESAVANAEAQLSTTLVRLDVAERALKTAEVGAEENMRSARMTIESLQAQVANLQTAVSGANETAAAAQRTAAVAARVMADGHLENDELRESPSFQSERASERVSERASVSSPGVSGAVGAAGVFGEPFSPGVGSDTRRASSVVNLGSRLDREFLPEGSAAADVASRDEQIAVLMSQIAEMGVMLDDAQEESACREEQVALLKTEVQDLATKLNAADKLKDGTPFGLLRTTAVHFMRTGDPALLPVLGTVLGVSEEEMESVRKGWAGAKQRSTTATSNSYVPAFLRPCK